MHILDGIDHPVVAVRDLEAAAARYRRLGFAVTPRGAHAHRGVGNVCVMFPHDYIELRTDLAAGRIANGVAAFLASGREGYYGCVFRPAVDADHAYAQLRAREIHVEPPRLSVRDFELPDGAVAARFRLVAIAEGSLPGLMALMICEHLSHDALRPPAFMAHPNGATGLRSLVAVVQDRVALAAAAARIFGSDAVERRSRVDIVHVGRDQRIHAIGPDEAAALNFPRVGDAPQIVGMEIAVADGARLEAALASGGVAHSRLSDGVIRVAPDEAGVTILFSGQAGEAFAIR